MGHGCEGCLWCEAFAEEARQRSLDDLEQDAYFRAVEQSRLAARRGASAFETPAILREGAVLKDQAHTELAKTATRSKEATYKALWPEPREYSEVLAELSRRARAAEQSRAELEKAVANEVLVQLQSQRPVQHVPRQITEQDAVALKAAFHAAWPLLMHWTDDTYLVTDPLPMKRWEGRRATNRVAAAASTSSGTAWCAKHHTGYLIAKGCADCGAAEYCEYCGALSQGNFSIHRDGFAEGPEVPLCDGCGDCDDTVLSCEQIWEKIAKPGSP